MPREYKQVVTKCKHCPALYQSNFSMQWFCLKLSEIHGYDYLIYEKPRGKVRMLGEYDVSDDMLHADCPLPKIEE